MQNCFNPACNKPTSKMQTPDGKAINYVHIGGSEITACPNCIKKIILSVVGALNSSEGNIARETRMRLQKEADDGTILFEGQDESYAKLRIRQP